MPAVRRKYYLLWLRVEARDTYLIWSSADQEGDESIFLNDTGEDRLLLDDTGYLKSFPSIEVANGFAVAAGLRVVNEQPILHDLDHVDLVITHGAKGVVDYDDCLSAWNLYVDLAKSVSPRDSAFLSLVRDRFDIYNKLFSAAGVLSSDEENSVVWDRTEITELQLLLSSGRAALRRRLPPGFR